MAFSPDYRTYSGAGSLTDTVTMDQGLRSYMLRVYNWMASGLALTGAVAWGIANSPPLMNLFYQVRQTGFGHVSLQPTALAIIAMFSPMAFVLVLSFGVNKLSATAAQALFWAFCVAMGASLTNIFLIYAHAEIARVFFITAGTFAATSLYGYTTRRDLTGIGSFLMMAVFGLVIAMVVNMFIGSSALQLGISLLGVIVFTALTAYDTQRIKANYLSYARAMGPDGARKRSVFDALSLYLDFINLFQFLLSVMGNRNNN